MTTVMQRSFAMKKRHYSCVIASWLRELASANHHPSFRVELLEGFPRLMESPPSCADLIRASIF